MEILLIFPGFILAIIIIVIYEIKFRKLQNKEKPQNKVHFYLVKTSFMTFDLFLGYPTKNISSSGVWWSGNRMYVDNLKDYGINLSDYNNLKYDKPVEVFLNLED